MRPAKLTGAQALMLYAKAPLEIKQEFMDALAFVNVLRYLEESYDSAAKPRPVPALSVATRGAFEDWLKTKSDTIMWNTSDAMFAAWLGACAALPKLPSHAWCAAIDDELDATAAEDAQPVAPELLGIHQAIAEGCGIWRSCTGCYETNEGHPPNGAYFSQAFQCHLGSGCDECGGLGAVWDTTDYDAMANEMERDSNSLEQAA